VFESTNAPPCLRESKGWRGLATEFAGQTGSTESARFEEPQRRRSPSAFPTFTNELRQAMFEEPIRYMTDIAQRETVRCLTCFNGTDTFVNSTLA